MSEEPGIVFTTHTEVSEEVKKKFKGMTEKESSEYQLSEWVKGISLHNPIRDECCPDFSCCHPESLMDKDLRIKFSNANKMNDSKTVMHILGMALSGLVSEITDKKIYVAGEEDNTEH